MARMNTYLAWIAGGVASYLLGSMPFGYLLARSRGKDIRTLGSGNIGATNVYRSISKPLGLLTFALDFLKGLAGATLVPWAAVACCGAPARAECLPLFCGAMTVVGHNWTCFLGFRGGKGVSASAGMLVGLAPAAVGIAFAVWLAMLLAFRFMSLASIAAAAALGISAWPLYFSCHGWVFPLALTLLSCLAILRHLPNIRRLMDGTESKFSFGGKRAGARSGGEAAK